MKTIVNRDVLIIAAYLYLAIWNKLHSMLGYFMLIYREFLNRGVKHTAHGPHPAFQKRKKKKKV